MSFRKFLQTFNYAAHCAAASLMLLLAVISAGCGYDCHSDVEIEVERLPLSGTLSELREVAGSRVPLAEGSIYGGVVTANDLSGNFYRSIIIEDESGAVGLLLSLYDLAAIYPVGCRVQVDMSGLVAELLDGVVVVGAAADSWNSDDVRAIEGRSEIFRRVEVVERCGPREPRQMELPLPDESVCGCLVRVEGVEYVVEDEEVVGEYSDADWGTTYYGSEADRAFANEEGEVVIVRTSRYADFATQAIPLGRLALTGILYRDNYAGSKVAVLKIRDLEDVVRLEE